MCYLFDRQAGLVHCTLHCFDGPASDSEPHVHQISLSLHSVEHAGKVQSTFLLSFLSDIVRSVQIRNRHIVVYVEMSQCVPDVEDSSDGTPELNNAAEPGNVLNGEDVN